MASTQPKAAKRKTKPGALPKALKPQVRSGPFRAKRRRASTQPR